MNETIDIVQLMLQDVDRLSLKLKNFLESHNIITENKTLTELVTAVLELKTRREDQKYVGFVYDSNGYIIKAYYMDDFLEISQVPIDIAFGYYMLVDGKLRIDEERKRQIDEV